MKKAFFMALMVAGLLSCKQELKNELTFSGLKSQDFVTTHQGKQTALYVLRNTHGLEACITNYGGRLVSLLVPDKNKQLQDVVLGYGSIADYLASSGNYGALIGRYGNRIKDGRFTLDGKEYQLPQNNNGHCLHGGPNGFHTRVWDGEKIDAQTLKLHYVSKNGEEGFPGKLDVTVTYKLTDENALDIQYEATTDKPTVVNLTNHSYFNISGRLGSSVIDHYIYINADKFAAVDSTLIPIDLVPVDSTPMDLRMLTLVRAGVLTDYEQIQKGRGYDHNWVLNTQGDITKKAAQVYSDESGIIMDVYTNEPGIQFYSGNFMGVSDKGKNGVNYIHRGALCLETQHFPNSPNEPSFPSTVLRPGEKYFSRCIYKFMVAKD
jgi:aldose 1-epimerase